VVEILLGIANFEFPYFNVDDALSWFEKLPSSGDASVEGEALDDTEFMDAINSFEFDSRLCSRALGTPYLISLFTNFVYFGILLSRPFHKCWKPVETLRIWLKKKFMWNYLLRYFIQTALDIYFVAALNLALSVRPWQRFGQASTILEFVDYVNLHFYTLASVVLPIFIVVFFRRNFDHLKEDTFEHKWGTIYEDLDLSRKSILFQPSYFLVRRAALAILAIYVRHSVTAQIMIVLEMTMI
jgi:hypothetical protein